MEDEERIIKPKRGFIDALKKVHFQDTSLGARVAYVSEYLGNWLTPSSVIMSFLGMNEDNVSDWRSIGMKDLKRKYIVEDGDFTYFFSPNSRVLKNCNYMFALKGKDGEISEGFRGDAKGKKFYFGLNYRLDHPRRHYDRSDQLVSKVVNEEILGPLNWEDFQIIETKRDSIPELLLRPDSI